MIYDTAGRLAIDEPLMKELADIKDRTKPDDIFLVVDSMIGQDAVKTSRAFNDRLAVTGVILTKLDGDARGGAALSIKEVTGAPILFAGMGEGTDKLEPFRADGMASRILGMGDVVGLMQNFEDVIDQKKAEEDAARLMSGDFTLEDFLEQVRMIQKMGSLKDLVDKLPLGGMFPGGMPADVNLDDRELVRIEAMIQSMTKFEKRDVYSLVREPKRVERVAKGSGSKPEAVSELVQKFLFMKQMMGGLGQNLGMMGKIPGMKQMAMAKNMKKMMGGGGEHARHGAARHGRLPRHARHGRLSRHARHGDARHGRVSRHGGLPRHGRRRRGSEPHEDAHAQRERAQREEGAAQARARRAQEGPKVGSACASLQRR